MNVMNAANSEAASRGDAKQVGVTDWWRIEVTERGVSFARYSGERCIEQYGIVDMPRAGVYASAIIQGFEPPRNLRLVEPARLGWSLVGERSPELVDFVSTKAAG